MNRRVIFETKGNDDSMKTKRIYEFEPYRFQETCEVLYCEPKDEHWVVILDRTLFYPTGGGQPHDLGELGSAHVLDVYEEEGVVYHISDAPFSAGDLVQATVDRQRRIDHMQQHSGQHILSAAFEELLAAHTCGFHLGEEMVTIDLAISQLTAEDAQRVEQLANEIVMENREIDISYIPRQQLPDDLVEKANTTDESLRIVRIAGVDRVSPCCGTHPFHTGEVGLIKIVKWESYKGMIRLYFLCGKRALQYIQQLSAEVDETVRFLKTDWTHLRERVEQLHSDWQENKRQVRRLYETSIRMESEQLALEPTEQWGRLSLYILQWPERPFQEVKDLAKTLMEQPDRIVLLVSGEATQQVIAGRSNNVQLSMKDLLAQIFQHIEGKGGGSANFAQGTGRGEAVEFWLPQVKRWMQEQLEG